MHPYRSSLLHGMLVALLGFVITRVFVAEAIGFHGHGQFAVVGLFPLVVGLLVTVFGVSLAIGAFPHPYVRSVTRWGVLGVGGAAGVVAVSAVGSMAHADGVWGLYETPLLVANVLLAGLFAGLVIGDRSAKNDRERRENRRQANRAIFVNRLLRHEVLNAGTIIDGHAALIDESGSERPESVAAIRRAADRIRNTVEDVGDIAGVYDPSRRADLSRLLTSEAATVADNYPEMTVTVDVPDGDVRIPADRRFERVIRELLRNAAENGSTRRIAATVIEMPRFVELSIADDGGGFPPAQRTLLESGEFAQFDDPTVGFGHQIVHLLTHQFGGAIAVEDGGIDGSGTTIRITFPRNGAHLRVSETVRISFPNLSRATVSGLVAGIGMGVFLQVTTGFIPVVGALYGSIDPLVGWVTHLFHSVVFALLFVAGCADTRLADLTTNLTGICFVGVAWGTVLWLVAAGAIMPLWLSLVGVPSTLPNLTLLGFISHGMWGITLAIVYWVLHTSGVGES